MALQDILDKINKDFDNEIDKLKNEFEKKKESLKKKTEEKKVEAVRSIKAKVESNSEKIYEKADTLAKIEKRNMLLEAKRSIIKETLEEAINEITTNEDYEEYLSILMKKAGKLEDAKIIFNTSQEEKIKNAMKKAEAKYELSPTNAATVKGGFILQTKQEEFDFTIESIFNKYLYDKLEIELPKILFT